ncbi:hypothetical protein GBAR_LOCUS22816 [Geodia barretti]|uniref:Uncharacterized protein n=1 Tax=Geodia barretti TaxID=519541 RepID=A0AA35T413_GEOBA|nr:hypothetical protein GBAR_LOCUS22816 [Geodia barretti]
MAGVIERMTFRLLIVLLTLSPTSLLATDSSSLAEITSSPSLSAINPSMTNTFNSSLTSSINPSVANVNTSVTDTYMLQARMKKRCHH